MQIVPDALRHELIVLMPLVVPSHYIRKQRREHAESVQVKPDQSHLLICPATSYTGAKGMIPVRRSSHAQ
jgi:hypothetical protein